MKKIVSLLVLCLSLQPATSFATTQPASNVQEDVAVLIEHAQSHNLSAEQTLLLAQQAIDQAAHVENVGIEVQPSNHRKIMIIAGVVVVVIVIGGIAYYYYSKNSEKKITTAQEFAEELVKNIDEIFISQKNTEEWVSNKGQHLDDTDVVCLKRALENVRKLYSAETFDKNLWKNALRDNLVRLVKEESVKTKPASAAEIEEARSLFTKNK